VRSGCNNAAESSDDLLLTHPSHSHSRLYLVGSSTYSQPVVATGGEGAVTSGPNGRPGMKGRLKSKRFENAPPSPPAVRESKKSIQGLAMAPAEERRKD